MSIILEVEGTGLPYLSFRNVRYEIAGRKILNDLNFDLNRGEVLVLLGRSGSGKTTALRLINRILDPTAGTITIEGQNISGTDPIQLRRKIGYVIQDFGLMPHWTVGRNVALVPKLLGWSEERQRSRSREMLAQVSLPPEDYFERMPHQLSGGQRQRVGVARAFAGEPKILLFDEPFGALDPVTRHDMQEQFKKLQKQYNVAAVFVTHDLLEALNLGTKIAILSEGVVEALVSPAEFWTCSSPLANLFKETLPAEFAPK